MRIRMLLGAVSLVLCVAQVRAEEETPHSFRFGIGVGYALPADLSSPNLVAATFLFKRLEIQPSVVFQKSKSKMDDGVINATDVESQNGAGATFRYAFSRRGQVDFQFIGSLNFSKSTADPEGPNNKATSKAATVSQGLGLEWWFLPDFSLTATALNPLYDHTSTRVEDIAGITKTTDVSYGFVWDPNISFVVTMWF